MWAYIFIKLSYSNGAAFEQKTVHKLSHLSIHLFCQLFLVTCHVCPQTNSWPLGLYVPLLLYWGSKKTKHAVYHTEQLLQVKSQKQSSAGVSDKSVCTTHLCMLLLSCFQDHLHVFLQWIPTFRLRCLLLLLFISSFLDSSFFYFFMFLSWLLHLLQTLVRQILLIFFSSGCLFLVNM